MSTDALRTCIRLSAHHLNLEKQKPLPNFQYIMAHRRDLKDFNREVDRRK